MWRNYYVYIYSEYSLCFSLTLQNWQIKENLVKNPDTHITKENKKSTDFASRSRIHVVWLNHLFTVTIFPFIWPSPNMMFWILSPITGINKLMFISTEPLNLTTATIFCQSWSNDEWNVLHSETIQYVTLLTAFAREIMPQSSFDFITGIPEQHKISLAKRERTHHACNILP